MTQDQPDFSDISPATEPPVLRPDQVQSSPSQVRDDALRSLEALQAAVTTKEVAEALAVCEATQADATNVILNFEVKDLADFLAREQLIGEIRGLRRMSAELNDRREALVEQTKT